MRNPKINLLMCKAPFPLKLMFYSLSRSTIEERAYVYINPSTPLVFYVSSKKNCQE